MADEQGATARETYDPHAGIDKWLRLWREERLFEAEELTPASPKDDKRTLVVSMFPYPSGDLHMGHAEVYSISDTMARFARMRGQQVLNPIAWDSFGLPAENAARKRNLDPRDWTYGNIDIQAESFERLGISFDWRTRFHTSDPEYYRWNQWLFLKLFERGLAYRKEAPVNWCPTDETVLANEQVIQGKCERCGTDVVKRNLTQWFFRTTEYAQRLLDDMDQLQGKWPDEILSMQRHWIGRSTGAHIDFQIEGRDEPVRVFSTRPDTLYGATFFVVAADSALADELCDAEHRAEFDKYRAGLASKAEMERLAIDRPMTGVFLGRHAVNPVSGEKLPVYASDYVLADYGTGAVMAVPAHDQRDLNFARAFDLPVRAVVDTGEPDPAVTGIATAGDGVLMNSGPLNGLRKDEAIAAVIADLEQRGVGQGAVTYRLRDWLLSRQRYWGTPIPIVYCDSCGAVPVPEEQLPVKLPESGYTLRPEGGKSPLETATEWVGVDCPSCGRRARRDTDTMDTFVDSSWYFLRYPNPRYEDGPFDPAGVAAWLPVDEYIGGKEHATGHLMYSRFLTKVLYDLGLVPFTEPFTRLTNQGQVIMNGKAMSKSLGNLVNLQEQIAQHGPDAVRVTMLFASPPEDDIDWADVSPAGSVKWLARVWRLAGDVGNASPAPAADAGDLELRKVVHRLIDDATQAMESKRFNVGIACLMKLTNTLRQAVDRQPGPDDAAVQEGTAALVRMLSCVAPFTAEEGWVRLGQEPSVLKAGWPEVDPALLVEEQVTCVVQVAGKFRDRIEVSPDISEEELQQLALQLEKVQAALGDASIAKVIVRAPKLVNFVPARG
ncbi:leucine--tRNA ligase [Streptomyces sp. NPDC048341]|uniref:leucine--tRNA ligase n=1 Tax=Streptomyces sp. NPDC048341 TaxID=3154620 RepID=UPI00342DFF9B